MSLPKSNLIRWLKRKKTPKSAIHQPGPPAKSRLSPEAGFNFDALVKNPNLEYKMAK